MRATFSRVCSRGSDSRRAEALLARRVIPGSVVFDVQLDPRRSMTGAIGNVNARSILMFVSSFIFAVLQMYQTLIWPSMASKSISADFKMGIF